MTTMMTMTMEISICLKRVGFDDEFFPLMDLVVGKDIDGRTRSWWVLG